MQIFDIFIALAEAGAFLWMQKGRLDWIKDTVVYICEFILNDINREISFLQKQKQDSINAVRQQVEFEKEKFMMQNPNMMFSAVIVGI